LGFASIDVGKVCMNSSPCDLKKKRGETEFNNRIEKLIPYIEIFLARESRCLATPALSAV
jgi:hypothetical protein